MHDWVQVLERYKYYTASVSKSQPSHTYQHNQSTAAVGCHTPIKIQIPDEPEQGDDYGGKQGLREGLSAHLHWLSF